jgi:hypothetical protein
VAREGGEEAVVVIRLWRRRVAHLAAVWCLVRKPQDLEGSR